MKLIHTERQGGIRLLDVACGPGYVSEDASVLGVKAIGVDFSTEMIRLAQQRYAVIDFRLGEARRP